MAIDTNELTRTSRRDQIINQTVTPKTINASSADASLCEEIEATPGAGYAHCVERLTIGIGAAITVTVGSGENTNAVEGDTMGPIGGAAGTYVLDFRDRPVQLTANKSLTVDASGAGTVCVIAEIFKKAV